MKIGYLLFPILLGVLTVNCSGSDSAEMVETISTDVGTPLAAAAFLDISYGESPAQVYDLYLPEGRSAENTKVILLIHGGGWVEGDKEGMQQFVEFLQQEHPDYAIANMNYRLAQPPLVPAFPNQFLDVARALDSLSAKSVEYAIKPEFGLVGSSAGAHLALQYDYVYDLDDQVKMVCSIVGPTDLTDDFYRKDARFALALPYMIDAGKYPQGTDLAAAVSPAMQVGPTSSPTLMFYGADDPLVPISNAYTLKASLDAFNIPAQLTVYEGGHGNWSLADLQDLRQKVTAFLNLYLDVKTD